MDLLLWFLVNAATIPQSIRFDFDTNSERFGAIRDRAARRGEAGGPARSARVKRGLYAIRAATGFARDPGIDLRTVGGTGGKMGIGPAGLALPDD
jgi:hypothetical protein